MSRLNTIDRVTAALKTADPTATLVETLGDDIDILVQFLETFTPVARDMLRPDRGGAMLAQRLASFASAFDTPEG